MGFPSKYPISNGQRFGGLVVSGYAGNGFWSTACDCGGASRATAAALTKGLVSSCGCKLTKHGQTDTRLYRVWKNMRDRCSRATCKSFHRYGGRGIQVCDQWQEFAAFASDMGDPPTPKHTLERIDNNGDYAPGNCRWATKREQNQNRERRADPTPYESAARVRALREATGFGARRIAAALGVKFLFARGVIYSGAWLKELP